MCHASSVSWLWYLNNTLQRPGKKKKKKEIILVSALFQLLLKCCQEKHDCLIKIIKTVFSVQTLYMSQARLVQAGMEQTCWAEQGEAPEGFHDEGLCVQRRISVSSNIWRPAEANLKCPPTACLLMMGRHGVLVYLKMCVCACVCVPHHTAQSNWANKDNWHW